MIKFIHTEAGYIIMTDTAGHTYRATHVNGVWQGLCMADGLAPDARHSSTMDFAMESGFPTHDAAWQIFNEALAQYNSGE
jgi:hypothetical protein